MAADGAEADFVDAGRDRIISEILDAVNTKSLLSQAGCDGYVLSNRIVSNYLAQVWLCLIESHMCRVDSQCGAGMCVLLPVCVHTVCVHVCVCVHMCVCVCVTCPTASRRW